MEMIIDMKYENENEVSQYDENEKIENKQLKKLTKIYSKVIKKVLF